MHYQVEIPFPFSHLKNEEKTSFALVIVISNWRDNILYNVKLWMYMSYWQFCMILMGLHYQIEILFPVSHLKKKNIGETIWNSIFCCSFENEKTGFALIIGI